MESHSRFAIDPNMHHQELKLADDALKMTSPFKCMLVASSGMGKSNLLLKMLQDCPKYFDKEWDNVIFCCPPGSLGLMNKSIQEFRNVFQALLVYEGIFDVANLREDENTLLIMEDMWEILSGSESFATSMTFWSRKKQISYFITCQNYFHATKTSIAQTIRRNQTHLILWYGYDKTLISHMSRLLFPRKSNFLLRVYEKILEDDPNVHNAYIYFDMHPNSKLPLRLRMRTNITDEFPVFVISKSCVF